MNEKVFISYSRKDTEWADKIKSALEAKGVACWMDRAGISAGEKYTREIISAIKRCEIFLLVLSPNAEQSEWVPKELGKAIQYRKYIIPAKITDFEIEEFELQLENIQIFDLNSVGGKQALVSLVNTVKGVLELNSTTEEGAGDDSGTKSGSHSDPGSRSSADSGTKSGSGTPSGSGSHSDPGSGSRLSAALGKNPDAKKKLIPIAAGAAVVLIGLFLFLGKSAPTSGDETTVAAAVTLPSEESGEEETVSGQVADNETESTGAGSVSSQESIEELIGYMDQAETLLEDTSEEITSLTIDRQLSEESLQTMIGLSEDALSQLEKLQEQAGGVNDLDPNLKAAGKEYFVMLYESQKNSLEAIRFTADHWEWRDGILTARPKAEEYPVPENYYNALNKWYQSARKEYEAIETCPAFLTPQWERYGEVLDLNKSICDKLNLSQKYTDNLRYQSAVNMSERFLTAESMQYDELLKGLTDENLHSDWQRSSASELAEEIRAYAGLGDSERDGYEFEHVITGEIRPSYDAITTIYPSLYSSYDAFLIIRTGCVSGTRKVVVEAEIPGFTQKYKETLTLDPSYQAIYVKPPALTGELDLSAAKDAQIQVRITEPDGTVIEEKPFAVTIKSKYDFEWYTDEYGISTKDNILCFMAPESDAIARLKRQAIEEMSAITDGKVNSFVGYQGNPWNNRYIGTYVQAAGIMEAMHQMGVRYNADAFSISGSNQHILFPEEVLELKSGLCIETSLVVASALQSAGMHTFLVFPPGHAQVAVEVWDKSSDSDTGRGKYFLIETTAISGSWKDAYIEGIASLVDNKGPKSGPITYMNQESWYNYITKPNTYLIDCKDASVLGMTPFAN